MLLSVLLWAEINVDNNDELINHSSVNFSHCEMILCEILGSFSRMHLCNFASWKMILFFTVGNAAKQYRLVRQLVTGISSVLSSLKIKLDEFLYDFGCIIISLKNSYGLGLPRVFKLIIFLMKISMG